MHRKIAILRGINVGGKRKLLMADLKLMFADLGFHNIKTYIQSGNVIFDTEKDIDNFELGKMLEKSIEQNFQLDVPVIVRRPEEIEASVKENPYNKTGVDHVHLFLTFLDKTPEDEDVESVDSDRFDPDVFIISGKEIFIQMAGKAYESKMTNNFFEKKLKVRATTRNWRTVLKLLELSRGDG